MRLTACNAQIFGQRVIVVRRKRACPGQCRRKCFLSDLHGLDHLFIRGATLMLFHLGALEHTRQSTLRMRIKRANAFRQVVLRSEVIFVDLLKQLMQRAEGHARHVPMKILRKHRCHGGLCDALVQGVGDSGSCIGG